MLHPERGEIGGGAAATARRVIVPLDVPMLIAVNTPRDAELLSLAGDTMGTTWSVKCARPPHLSGDSIRSGIQAVLDGVIAQMSTWIDTSDISRFNRSPANSWCTLPEDFRSVLAYALALAQQTDGAYDPTIGALVDLWGFGPPSRPGRIPADGEITNARQSPGWRAVKFDNASRAFQPGGVQLDLSSIAKGFAVDKVSAWLGARGVTHHLVEIGGELGGQGIKPDGSPWWVALESFRAGVGDVQTGVCEAVVALHGLAVATSGDNVRFFEKDGARLSHTIDPRSGRPVAHDLTSVTVFHRSCMQADALATALFVLGPVRGFEFAARNDIAARFVMRRGAGFDEKLTSALAAMID